MKVAILGSGPSLAEFKRERYRYAIGCNDIWSRGAEVDAVACADDWGKVKRTRPNYLQTPKHLPTYVIAPAPEWQQLVGERNIIAVKTLRWQVGLEHDATDTTRPVWHGYHSPFFAASLAIHYAGATALDFYGVDGADWAPRNIACIIAELNYLNAWLPVRLASSSELWQKQMHPKCGLVDRAKGFIKASLEVGIIE